MKYVSVLLLLFTVVTIQAQSIVGTWKRTANVLEYDNGTKQDLQKPMEESMPCVTTLRYVFEAGGKHYLKGEPACQEAIRMGSAQWKMSGRTLVVKTTAKNSSLTDETTYTLTFRGNSVVFEHVYTAAEKAKLGVNVKKISLTYQRL